MKKYLAPSYDEKPNPPKSPEECEIQGCLSRRVGPNSFGEYTNKPGKADVFVKDKLEQNRGVCCYHYSKIVDESGKGRLSAVMDENGEVTRDSMKKHWDKLDADPYWESRQIHRSDDPDKAEKRASGLRHINSIAASLGIKLGEKSAESKTPAIFQPVASIVEVLDDESNDEAMPEWFKDRP